jgi:hypothetical protein
MVLLPVWQTLLASILEHPQYDLQTRTDVPWPSGNGSNFAISVGSTSLREGIDLPFNGVEVGTSIDAMFEPKPALD